MRQSPLATIDQWGIGDSRISGILRIVTRAVVKVSYMFATDTLTRDDLIH